MCAVFIADTFINIKNLLNKSCYISLCICISSKVQCFQQYSLKVNLFFSWMFLKSVLAKLFWLWTVHFILLSCLFVWYWIWYSPFVSPDLPSSAPMPSSFQLGSEGGRWVRLRYFFSSCSLPAGSSWFNSVVLLKPALSAILPHSSCSFEF